MPWIYQKTTLDDFLGRYETHQEWYQLELKYSCRGCHDDHMDYDMDLCLDAVLLTECSYSNVTCKNYWSNYVTELWNREGSDWSDMVCTLECEGFSDTGTTCKQEGLSMYKVWAGVCGVIYGVLGVALMAVSLAPIILLRRYRRESTTCYYENDLCLDDSDSL